MMGCRDDATKVHRVYFTSCPIAFGKWIANIKNHIALFALLHFGGESAESARQKNDSANFYTSGMACRAMDDV